MFFPYWPCGLCSWLYITNDMEAKSQAEIFSSWTKWRNKRGKVVLSIRKSFDKKPKAKLACSETERMFIFWRMHLSQRQVESLRSEHTISHSKCCPCRTKKLQMLIRREGTMLPVLQMVLRTKMWIVVVQILQQYVVTYKNCKMYSLAKKPLL